MTARELSVIVVAALCSISIMGWIVWSERADRTPLTALPVEDGRDDTGSGQISRDVDEVQVATLQTKAESTPEDISSRLALGDLYFRAGRFDEAIPWFEQAIALDPAHGEGRTNLGVSYYYSGQTSRAVETFEYLLEIYPEHQRALLSLGIVKAFGLQDLDGAMAAWERVIEIAPDSPEGLAARDSLERIRAAHESSGSDLP